MIRPLALAAACLLLAACGGGGGSGQSQNNTSGAQNSLGGMGEGPAPKEAGGGLQSPGNTSGDAPEGEVSPSGPGGANTAR